MKWEVVGFDDQMQFRHLAEMWLVAFQATLTILLQLWENNKILKKKKNYQQTS